MNNKKEYVTQITLTMEVDPVTIVTHDGPFHADEVLAIAAMFETGCVGEDARVVRTRDPRKIAEGDVVIDVGGVYDPAKFKFDHHQRGGAGGPEGTRPSGIHRSSAGLVWLKIAQTTSISDVAWAEVDRLMETIDAHDNGQALSADSGLFPGVAPAMTLSGVIAAMNPSWLDATPEATDAAFHRAVAFARGLISSLITRANAKHLAHDIVRDGMRMRADPRVLVLDRFCPWQERLADIEASSGTTRFVQFVIFPNAKGEWMVQGAPDGTPFGCRARHAEHLRGLPAGEICAQIGIDDALFVHQNGFIGAARSIESAIKLAEYSLSHMILR